MEEKKNNQVQAMEDESLENVSGGWRLIGTSEYNRRFDFSDDELLKLIDAGVGVRKDGDYYKITGWYGEKGKSSLEVARNILGDRYL